MEKATRATARKCHLKSWDHNKKSTLLQPHIKNNKKDRLLKCSGAKMAAGHVHSPDVSSRQLLHQLSKSDDSMQATHSDGVLILNYLGFFVIYSSTSN